LAKNAKRQGLNTPAILSSSDKPTLQGREGVDRPDGPSSTDAQAAPNKRPYLKSDRPPAPKTFVVGEALSNTTTSLPRFTPPTAADLNDSSKYTKMGEHDWPLFRLYRSIRLRNLATPGKYLRDGTPFVASAARWQVNAELHWLKTNLYLPANYLKLEATQAEIEQLQADSKIAAYKKMKAEEYDRAFKKSGLSEAEFKRRGELRRQARQDGTAEKSAPSLQGKDHAQVFEEEYHPFDGSRGHYSNTLTVKPPAGMATNGWDLADSQDDLPPIEDLAHLQSTREGALAKLEVLTKLRTDQQSAIMERSQHLTEQNAPLNMVHEDLD
jgi:hypothetical protein